MIPVKHLRAWLFFGGVYLGSWACWLPFVLAHRPTPFVLLLLGLMMPSLLGIVFTYLTQDRKGRNESWSHVTSVQRIGLGWFALILVLFPALLGLAGLFYLLSGGSGLSLAHKLQLVSQPWQLLVFLLTLLVGGPLTEELGWRGFALDRLQARWNAFPASLILGSIWALWHLPLFTPGTAQYGMGVGTADFWLVLVSIISLAVIITWVYNHTQRSVLAAMLLHFAFNTTFALLSVSGRVIPVRALFFRTSLQMLVALIVGTWQTRTPRPSRVGL
jgi:CAAX protease family protein